MDFIFTSNASFFSHLFVVVAVVGSVYRKWNELFFRECYAAYAAGRSDTNPALTWYKGEIGFFDYYIIPLAKKLESCGVFGKSSDEFLVRLRAIIK